MKQKTGFEIIFDIILNIIQFTVLKQAATKSSKTGVEFLKLEITK